jgi:DNA-binding transcriptional MerR regulator
MAQGKAYQASDVDRTFVERAVMAGTPIEKIAECLNVHDDTLRKHFRYEIMTGRERLKGDAIRVLADSLTDNSLDAAKFVLARVAGWTEKPDEKKESQTLADALNNLADRLNG